MHTSEQRGISDSLNAFKWYKIVRNSRDREPRLSLSISYSKNKKGIS